MNAEEARIKMFENQTIATCIKNLENYILQSASLGRDKVAIKEIFLTNINLIFPGYELDRERIDMFSFNFRNFTYENNSINEWFEVLKKVILFHFENKGYTVAGDDLSNLVISWF